MADAVCVSQLRSALHDVEEVADKDDHYLLRWLRARKFNVPQAEDMLRKVWSPNQPATMSYDICIISVPHCLQHIDVRRKYKLAAILTDYKPVEVRYYTHKLWYCMELVYLYCDTRI